MPGTSKVPGKQRVSGQPPAVGAALLSIYATLHMKRSHALLPSAILTALLAAVLLGNARTARAAICPPQAAASARESAQNEGLLCATSIATGLFATPAPRSASILAGARYGWVEDYARFYAAPQPGAEWIRTASAGFFYGQVRDQATGAGGQEWLKVWGNWMPARYFHQVPVSAFTGVEVNARPPRPFGWLLREFETRAEPGGEAQPGAPVLQRYDFVQVYAKALGSDGAVWYDVGQGRWVRYHVLALLAWREQPRGLEPDEFWVDVDLSQQTFAAYEGRRMVFAGLVSSGLARWPTRRGLFRVRRRYLTTPMAGGELGDDYYYIERVPHTVFFDGDIALHGAYWHDDFGRPKSHGCVNIAPRAAEWLYYWSMHAPGPLRVWVHNSHHSEFG